MGRPLHGWQHRVLLGDVASASGRPTDFDVWRPLLTAAVVFFYVHATRGDPRLALAAAPVILWPFRLAAAHVPEPPQSYRYAFVLLPSLFVMVGWAITQLRWEPARAAVAVVLAILAVAATIRTYGPPTNNFRAVPATDPTVASLIGYLRSAGQTHIYANYWIAYVLTLATNEKITAADPSPGRYPSYARAAAHQARSTYVYTANYYTGLQLQKWTSRHHEGQRTVVAIYAIYQFDRPVDPAELPLFVDPA